jgi:hypothetical protein
MSECKVVPFTAQITRQDTNATVAAQMQAIIDSYKAQGWEYEHMASVQTSVAGTDGCFGIGAQPGYITSFNVLVFTR